jgi:hypothetical protein
MLVRYEADACVESSATHSPRVSRPLPSEETSTSRQHLNTAYGLIVLRGGTPVHESSIVELKALKGESPLQPVHLSWSQHYPQLYFSQTQHAFVATHRDGLVHNVTKKNIKEATQTELTFPLKLRKLHRVLKSIQEIVVKAGVEGRLSLVSQDGELEAFERIHRGPCLPNKVMARFSKVPV